MTSKDIKALLYNKYPVGEYALFTEVANGTGAMGHRYADAVAYNLFPSKGYEIQGFEIKVSRSDFLNEMKDPSKSDAVMRYCHRWWLVAEKGVCVKEEVPINWGFMEVVNGRFYVRKNAPQLKPVPIDASFCASLLRRATEGTVPREALHTLVTQEAEKIREGFKSDIEREKKRYEKLHEKVERFEKLTGININSSYRPIEEFVTAMNFVLGGGFRSIAWDTDRLVGGLQDVIKSLKEVNRLAKSEDEGLKKHIELAKQAVV